MPTLFALLTPGATQHDQGSNVVRGWSNDGASGFYVNGGRGTASNNFQLDGMPNAKTGGDISFIPPMDSVQEFRVQTNAYDASIGRQAGATINMETKSGGKQYHGVLYEYNQNNFLNANTYENNLMARRSLRSTSISLVGPSEARFGYRRSTTARAVLSSSSASTRALTPTR